MEDEYVEEIGETGQNVGNDTTENENVVNKDVELSEEQSETTENMDINNNVDSVPIIEELDQESGTKSETETSVNTIVLADEQYTEILNNLKIISHAEVISITFLLSILIYIFIHNMLERRKI